MNEPTSIARGSVPDRGMHLTDWTVEQMADGALAADERAAATEHLESCARCAAELDAYRALFAALSELPRFAPSAAFSEAVMARTRVMPEPGPFATWLREFMPRTRRGWALLSAAVVAPSLPVLAAAFWLVTHPLLSPSALVEWVVMEGRGAAQAVVTTFLGWTANLGVVGIGRGAYQLAQSLPSGAVPAVIVFLGIAMPVSAWALVRLVRTPNTNGDYANRSA